MITPWQLRARFARSLSEMYGREVPAYTTLVDVSREVNEDVVRAEGPDAERLGSLDRVTAERHGAIRLGTPRELAQVARIFGAMGMFPVGFYDLRDAAPSPVPVISTAFRPIDEAELARNPFRVFTSLLATSDRRFFSAELQARLEAFLQRRELFPPELLELADRAEQRQALSTSRFRALHRAGDPVVRALARAGRRGLVSRAGAHLGSRRRHRRRRIDAHQPPDAAAPRHRRAVLAHAGPRHRHDRRHPGPAPLERPGRPSTPDVVPRARRAPAFPSRRRHDRGDRAARALRRGRSSRDRPDRRRPRAVRRAVGAGRRRRRGRSAGGPRGLAIELWSERFPATEHQLALDGLAFFTYDLADDRPADGRTPPPDAAALLEDGWVVAHPIVYDDFLPRSAAGIFQSNLSDGGSHDETQAGARLDAGWMAGGLERELLDPIALYTAQQQRSLDHVHRALGIDAHHLTRS